jgi:hypothetical protein
VLLANPTEHIARWRRQLGLILRRASQTIEALSEEAAQPGIRESTRARIRELARAIAEQADDIKVAVGPGLGGSLPPEDDVGLPRGATNNLGYLFRDWAWSGGHDDENKRALAAIRRVSHGQTLGRVLVLGAGACRLAYDLHIHCGGTATSVVDIDPYLLLIAAAVIAGVGVTLTETNANATSLDSVSRRWTLAAPAGPLAPQHFRFFLADGTEPPFGAGTFDTVVTPWFVDQVPLDLPELLLRIHALLAPGGRWINRGPLLYRPDLLSIGQWYAREEIFEVAASAGFRMGAWESASEPNVVSPLTGRGLVENVVTFEARRA